MARGPYPAILRIARAAEKIFGVPVNGSQVIYPAIIRIAQALEASKIENIDDVLEKLENDRTQWGYYHENEFYKNPDYTEVLERKEKVLYVDLSANSGIYRYGNGVYDSFTAATEESEFVAQCNALPAVMTEEEAENVYNGMPKTDLNLPAETAYLVAKTDTGKFAGFYTDDSALEFVNFYATAEEAYLADHTTALLDQTHGYVVIVDFSAVNERIDNIDALIPDQASIDNKLADKAFVEELINSLKTFMFRGYVSPSEPSNPKEGELWHLGTTMPTTFPINVKRYTNGAWTDLVEPYTPVSLDMWADLDDNHGYYWFGNAWNLIDVDVAPDNTTIDKNVAGQLQIKDGGVGNSKLDSNLKATTVGDTPSNDKLITEQALAQYIASGNGGNPKALSSIDLNSITATGFYSCDGCTNRPNNQNGTMVVVRKANADSIISQFYTTFVTGDIYTRVKDAGNWKAWTQYAKKSDLSAYRTSADQDEIDNAQDEEIGKRYTKPTSGIPKTDLASGVQESLDKANTAYQKASSGIPKTDLSSEVQTSLGKADNAQPKETGKGLSTNDYTTAEKNKLSGIEAGAEKNIVNGIKKNGTSQTPDENGIVDIIVPVSASDVGALPDTVKYGSSLEVSMNSTTYVCTFKLKDQDGNLLGTQQTIDFPLESVVVSGRYDSTTKKIILTLQSGSEIEIPVASLVSGLVNETQLQQALAQYYTKTEADGKYVAKVSGSSLVPDSKVNSYDSHIADSTIHVTSAEKAKITGLADASDFSVKVRLGFNQLLPVGGRIFYIHNDNGATYHFYDNLGNELLTQTVEGLADAVAYTVSGTHSVDKFYVFNNSIESGAWGWVGTNIGTADGIGKGKENTAKVMERGIPTDCTPNIWEYIKELNDSKTSGCNDWYIGTKAEQDKLRGSGLVAWYSNNTIWSSVEASGTSNKGAWHWWTYPSGKWDYQYFKQRSLTCFGMRSF